MKFFFRPREPRKFIHTPMYHDPRQEELKKRVTRARHELGLDDETHYAPHIKGEILARSSHVSRVREKKEKRKHISTQTIIVLLVLLLLFLVYLYRN